MVMGSSMENKYIVLWHSPHPASVRWIWLSMEALQQMPVGQVALLASKCPNRLGWFVIPLISSPYLPSHV